MSFKKYLFILLVIVGAPLLYWAINVQAYEQAAEERTDAYIKAQGADSETVLEKASRRNQQGRWEIVYKFEDEPDMLYEYTYDRSQDRMLLMVFHAPGSPVMSGGRSIERAFDYPKLKHEGTNWIPFDKQGQPITD